MPTTLAQIGEFGFIDLIKKKMKVSSHVIRGIGDDAAVVKVAKDKLLLLATDMLLEGVHFTRQMSSTGIGHKAMGCNISDIAAMGGTPSYALVSLGIPGKISLSFIRGIYEGMQSLARGYGISIVGGDTIKSNKIIINVALIGEAKKENIVLRSGAKAGDWIFVTGPLGKSFVTKWHLQFSPRLKESRYLVKNFKPTAMIDVSDGLAADLGHILEESRAGAVLEEVKIPRRKKASLQEALCDGEDFELVFTLPKKSAEKLLKVSNPFPFYWIGEIVKGREGGPLQLKDQKGRCRLFPKKGFVHF